MYESSELDPFPDGFVHRTQTPPVQRGVVSWPDPPFSDVLLKTSFFLYPDDPRVGGLINRDQLEHQPNLRTRIY